MNIRLKRAYERPEESDGARVLVDRIWPRGVLKDKAGLDEWMKDIAPSNGLRKWFNHDPGRWQEFVEKYFWELKGHPDLVDRLVEMAKNGRLTLVFGAKDQVHNNAAALKAYLEGIGNR